MTMANLTASSAPPQAAATVLIQSNLSLPRAAVAETAMAMAAPPAASVEITNAYPIYTTSAKALLLRKLLKLAKLTAWQYLVIEGESVRGAAEVVRRFSIFRTKIDYAGSYPAHYAERIVAAITTAEELPQVQARSYELRLLRAPDLSLLAVWLWRDDDSLLLPIAPAPGGLVALQVMSEQELTETLTPLARRRVYSSDE
jgi:hypothetical protein